LKKIEHELHEGMNYANIRVICPLVSFVIWEVLKNEKSQSLLQLVVIPN